MMIPQTTPLRPETALCSNLDRRDGHLRFAGQDTIELAKTYGTPLYLMDEDRVRYNCRLYREAFSTCFPEGSQVLYASKAAAFQQMCRIVGDEGLGLDVVSSGEIHTAKTAGFPMARVYYHGNNKTDATPPSAPARWTPSSACPSRPARRSPSCGWRWISPI